MTDKLLDDLKAALGEAYLIERELTGGGMSRVFVAREHALGREVVIKVLPPELAAGINRERFRREVQLAARISHPYIVPLLHAGEAGELLWFTMPYIPGESLRARLEQQGPLPVREVVQLLRDVVEALAYAHTRGVIHRDIKPANILSDGAHALVTDFGVAKALGAALPLTGIAGHTTSGMAIGTPAYMAPEQLAADPAADHRVDIYAVGLLAYELLTGASPCAAPSPTATMTAQLTRTPDPLATVRPEVPPAFSSLVDRCLAKTPDARPADARAVLAELDRISGALAADAHREASGEAAAPAPRKASMVPLLIGAMAVVVLVAAGLWWSGGQSVAPPAVPDTVVVQGGADAPEGQPLGGSSQPLTRADSLAIAAALRDELERIDPEAAKAPEVTVTTPSAQVTLERQLSLADSLVRVKLAEISSRAEAAQAMAERSLARGNASIGRAMPTEAGRRSVLVVATPPRRSDPALSASVASVASEIRDQLARRPGWEVIDVGDDDVRVSEIPAQVIVTVGAAPAAGDSVMYRVTVRNSAAGSSYGFNVVSSRPMALNAGPDAYRQLVRESVSMIESLRRVERGQEWQMDIGRPPRPPGTP